jgi:UDP-glucose 4-epimerase
MILIAGGAGFMGSALARTFQARGAGVRCVGTQRRPRNDIGAAEYVSADLRQVLPESKIFDGVTAIVHLASTTIPATSMEDMAFDARSNIELTLSLLEAARHRGISTFVFASSGGTVYGSPARLPARETDPTDPLTSYGIVKLGLEKYIGLYTRLHGLRGIVLRISNPYGIGQLSGTPIGVLAHLLLNLHDRTPFSVWGDGSVVRDYFHVDDLMRAFRAALAEPQIPAGVYNVGSGQGVSLRELVALAQEVTGQAAIVRYKPARSIDVPRIWLDTGKFRAATGWQPTISLEQGIRDLWQNLIGADGRRETAKKVQVP